MTERFNVIQFFPDGTYEYVLRNADAETAVDTAKSYTERPAAMIGMIRQVMITDDGDRCCFLWQYGRGVLFPHLKNKTPSRPRVK